MSEEARDDDNASSEKGRDGIFMEHYHSRMEEEGGGIGGLVLELPLLRITTSVSIHCTKLPFGAR